MLVEEHAELYRQAEHDLWEHYGAQPTERFLDLENPKVRVRVQEVGSGEPVLFIHGGPNAGSTWAPIAAQLQGFRCLLLDRPGCGLSEPLDYRSGSIRSLVVELLAALLDALELPNVHLVVSSYGGWFGLLFARAHPERVGRMVQHGCPALVPEMLLPPFMRILTLPGVSKLLVRMQKKPNPAGAKMSFRQMGHQASLQANRIPDSFWNWSAAMAAYTDTFANEVGTFKGFISWRGVKSEIMLTVDELQQITTPTLFFWGDADTFGGIALARKVVEAMPNATLEVVEGGGHLPWLDDPDRAARVTREFLTG